MKQTEDSAFVIEADEVKRLHKASGLSLDDFLATLVEPTRALARPPVSKFHVGAVGLGSSGRVYRGVNVEFPGLPLNFSIHAEQFLVANAARNGEHRLEFLAVSAAPCGHCRQFLQELRGAEDLRVLIADDKSEIEVLSHFLPHRFGPQDLLQDDFPLLLETQWNNLHLFPLESLAMSETLALHSSGGEVISGGELKRPYEEKVRNPPVEEVNGLTVADPSENGEDLKSASLPKFVAKHLTNSPAVAPMFRRDIASADQGLGPEQLDQLQKAAVEARNLNDLRRASLEAANSSYTPYTSSPSGLAIMTKKGSIYKGPYFESAAYNPSLPPLQTAVIAFIVDGGGSYHEISTVVLVEKEGAPVRQAAIVRLALEHISPLATFHVFQAKSS